MRKILLATLMVFVTHSVLASAYDWRMGTSGECFVKYVDAHRVFRYCGGGQSSCAGKKQRSRADAKTFTTGMIFKNDSSSPEQWWVCCNATASSQGIYKSFDTTKFKTDKGDGSIPTYSETITVDLEGGGRCSFKQTYDACGNTFNKACTEPTSCSDGLILRNGKCVEPCAEGSEFESVTTNKCVACETTMYQGPATMTADQITEALTSAKIFITRGGEQDGQVDKTKTTEAATAQADQPYCKKCNKDTQFYDKETKECINKSDMIKATAQEMAQCGLCVNNLVMTECIKCFAGIEEDGKTEDECKKQDSIKKNCFFPE
jgi:hypothetical protein